MPALGGVRQSVLIGRVREAADMEATHSGTASFVTDVEISSRIDEAAKDLYDKLVSSLGEDYFVTDANDCLWTNFGEVGDRIILPTDFYRLIAVYWDTKPGQETHGYRKMEPFQRELLVDLLNQPKTDAGPFFYRLKSVLFDGDEPNNLGDYLETYPGRLNEGEARVSYVPQYVTGGSDPIYPGIHGWEEYVVLSVAIRLLAKEESDTSELRAERDRIEARIESARHKRDVGAPERITLTRSDRVRRWRRW